MTKKISIALDGPSGAGKSTLAKAIAKKLSICYVDTGAIYRTLALGVIRANIDPQNADAVCAILDSLTVSLIFENGVQKVCLQGEDVSHLIRTPEVSMGASHVSKIPQVRKKLLSIQRELAETQSVIMDGRDIGTVVLPNADVKIFLDASPEVRARRRLLELREKGIETTLEQVLTEQLQRDENDRKRDIAPAIPADDAILLDNGALDFEGTVEAAMAIIRKACGI